MFISVGAIIYYRGKYLLQKRDKKKNIFFPNIWGVFGGTIEKNETPLQGIKRELKEELNLKFQNPQFFLKLTIKSKNFTPHRTRYFFVCKLPLSFRKDIILTEGQKFEFQKLEDIGHNDIVPWDFAALNYHYFSKIKKKQVLPDLS